jgi:hypothetical protein
LKAGATKQLLLLGPKHHTNPPGANPSSTRQATAAAWCSRGHGQRQCLVSLHVLDNFKAPFKPRCNCWSPVGWCNSAPILQDLRKLQYLIGQRFLIWAWHYWSLPCAHPGS